MPSTKSQPPAQPRPTAAPAQGRLAQMRQVYSMTRAASPNTPLWMLLAALLVLAVFLVIGLAVDHPVYLGLLGLPFAVLAAVIVLGRMAQGAAYAQIEGQPGAGGAILGELRRGWWYDQEPVAAEMGGRARGARDLANAAMVFRAVGRPGVVLVAEGPRAAADRTAAAESKRVVRLLGEGVPVHVLRVGSDDEAVPLGEVAKRIKALPKVLTDTEAEAVHQRLKALGGMRQRAQAGMPKGVDPNRVHVARRSTMR